VSTNRYDALLAEVQKLVPHERWDLVADLDEEVHWQLRVAEHAGAARTGKGRVGALVVRTEHRLGRLGTRALRT
jgi:hypothetical protein